VGVAAGWTGVGAETAASVAAPIAVAVGAPDGGTIVEVGWRASQAAKNSINNVRPVTRDNNFLPSNMVWARWSDSRIVQSSKGNSPLLSNMVLVTLEGGIDPPLLLNKPLRQKHYTMVMHSGWLFLIDGDYFCLQYEGFALEWNKAVTY
jgi:hypothetical protein